MKLIFLLFCSNFTFILSFFSLNTRFPILVLRILQPVLRMRTVGNPLYDETWLETETGFLAEDNRGNFLLVKLDSDVKDAPREWLPMLGKIQ